MLHEHFFEGMTVMRNSDNSIKRRISYSLLLGCLTLYSVNLSASPLPDRQAPGFVPPLRRGLQYLPRIPEVPPDESIDPIAVACSHITSFLENHVNPLPIVDWLNVSSLPSFFEPTVRSLLKREDYYNAIDALGKYSLGVRPYGFYSSFKLEKDTFKLATFGLTVDGAVTLDERWVVGGGLGYWHSNFDWGKKAHRNSVNSIYGGPFGGYVFDQAYIGLTLLGVYNIYNVNSLFIDGDNRRHEGWDIGARLEGGYDYEWPKYFGKNFFIQPNADFSYLWVYQNKIDETKELSDEEEFSASVGSRSYDFLRYRLGVTFKKEFHHCEKGILIPSLSMAWIFMQPLSASDIQLTCGDSDKKTIKHKKYPSSNQLYLGAKIIAINTRALMLSLGADVYIANLYPIYAGNLRFEWNW
jgi:outer membrane autotransporter protein